MKRKIMVTVLSAAVMLAFAGCSGNDKDAGDKGVEKKTEDTQEKAGAQEMAGVQKDAGTQEKAGAQKEAGTQEKESGAAGESSSNLLTTAETLVKDLIEGNTDNIKGNYEYTEQMKSAVESGQFQAAFQATLEAVGELKEVQPAWEGEPQSGYDVVQVPCDFAVQPINLSISFLEGKIGGVTTSVYQESKEEVSIPENVTETDMDLSIAKGRTLPGTFAVPKNLKEYPAVVFVHGSGSGDRNEAYGQLKPFQDLAWGLAKQGIASYRYDKISYVYGKEIAEEKEFTVYDETVNDAVAAVKMLREQEGVSKVYVVGHSQGAQMMGAIAREAKPDGCVMMAGPARGFAETLERQYTFLQSLNPNPSEQEKAVYEQGFAAVEQMKNIDSLSEDEKIMGQDLTYIKSLLDYDAVKEAEDMSMPVLVLQGEEDYQVTMDDFRIWKDNYEGKDNWKFVAFPGLSHMFMEGRYEDGPASYQGVKHIPDEVTDTIAGFING